MEPPTMRNFFSGSKFCFFFSPPLASCNDPVYDEAVVIERLKIYRKPLVENRYNSIVKGYIKGYLFWNRDKTERILGRTVMYFPLMEEYLSKRNMPDKPNTCQWWNQRSIPAVSRVGAVRLGNSCPKRVRNMDWRSMSLWTSARIPTNLPRRPAGLSVPSV